MDARPNIAAARDKLLFTPGPLTTSSSVKQAMLHDAGSWHFEFNALVKRIRDKLLALAGLSSSAGYEAILVQGSGTFGVEAVIASAIPPAGSLLVLVNGAYGERIVQMAQYLKLRHEVLRTPEDAAPDLQVLDRMLGAEKGITHVAVVHCETTTGILNPIYQIGQIVRQHGRAYIVDAMSSHSGVRAGVKGTR